MKPGIKTTEFWMTLVTTILMVLAAFGIVGQEEATEIKDLAGPLVASVLPVVAYVWSRTQVKKASG